MTNLTLFDLNHNPIKFTDHLIYNSKDVWAEWGYPSEAMLFLTAIHAAEYWRKITRDIEPLGIGRFNGKNRFYFCHEFGLMLSRFSAEVGFGALTETKQVMDDLYFIHETITNHIKIGRSQDVHRRLNDLQSANPGNLVLIKVVKGAGYKERQVHQMFSAIQTNNEWFRATPELIDFIKTLPSKVKPRIIPVVRSQPQPQSQTPPSPPQPQALPGNFMTADLTPEDKHYQQLKAIACDELKWKYRYRG